MIRFIDLRGQDTGYRFAFFDTITNQFVRVASEQVWQDRADLVELRDGYNNPLIKRLVGLMPEWAEVNTDDE